MRATTTRSTFSASTASAHHRAIGTGVFVAPALGGVGVDDYSMAGQV